MKKLTIRVRSTALGAGLLALPALSSAQVCVDPTGAGGCLTTIQAGIDAATAGQTVDLAPARYEEEVVIPTGKDGLVLDGGGAILDNPSDIDSLLILSNDVTVRGLELRNGRLAIAVGDGSTIPSGTVLSGLRVLAAVEDCVVLDGADDTLVTGSTFLACGASPIAAEEGPDADGADGLVVTKSTFRICDGGCIDVYGDDAVISSNRFAQSEDDPAIFIVGDRARVEKNSMTDVSGGVAVTGMAPVVIKNKLSGYTDGDGYDIACVGSCANAVVASNKAASGPDDAGAFYVHADDGGMLVEKNSSTQAADFGLQVEGVGVLVRSNKVKSSGGDIDESGFFVEGTGHTLEGNSSSGSGNDGFTIRGEDHVLVDNTATGNSGDGFDIDDENGLEFLPSAIALTGNVAKDNVGNGFSFTTVNLGTVVAGTLASNTASGNRTPLCNSLADGTITDGGGNSFPVAGAPACEVDHDY